MNSEGYILFAIAGGPLALAFLTTKFLHSSETIGRGCRGVFTGCMAAFLQLVIPGALLVFKGLDLDLGTKFIAIGLALSSIFAALALAVSGYKKIRLSERHFVYTANDRFFALSSLIAASYGVFWLNAHSFLPLQAWDALSFWAPQAQDYLTGGVGEARFALQESHHPWTISILFLAFPHGQLFAEPTNYSGYIWFFFAVEIALIVWGYSRYCQNSYLASSLLVITLLSIPLVENHNLLFGYSEIFLTLMLLAGYVLIIIGSNDRNTPLIVMGVVFLIACVISRNTGLVYAAVSVLALTFTSAARRRPIYAYLMGAGIIVIVLAVTNSTFKVGYGVLDFGFSEAKQQLYLGGKKLVFQFVDAASLWEVLVEQWWNNTSFSILLIATIFASIALWQRSHLLAGDYFLIWGAFGILAALFLSLFTEYGYLYAAPGNDTGNSRFHVPVVPLMFLVIAKAVSTLQQTPGDNELSPEAVSEPTFMNANRD